MDVINTPMQSHTGPRHVKGMSPPSVAENNQIILSGDTSSFRHGGDGASPPLLRLIWLSVSLWLYLTLSFPPFLTLVKLLRDVLTLVKPACVQWFVCSCTGVCLCVYTWLKVRQSYGIII